MVTIVQQHIQSFQITVGHDDFPCFLWEDERADPRDTNKGFLRGKILVKVLLTMLIGPSAARPGSQSSGAGGYADLLNLQTMTVPSLAFAAVIARYALSAESKCIWVRERNAPGFNNLVFYKRILSTVEAWGEDDRSSLIAWWNRAILSRLHGGVHSSALGDAPAPGSVAAAMLRQSAVGGDG